MPMSTQVKDILDRYLAAELGSLQLPDPDLLARQRAAFLARFGPEQLARMSGPALLRELPHNAANEQPMDYWLEFKNDDEFNCALFGSILGGSSAKFGTWQEKKTGSWRAQRSGSRSIQDIAEDEALRIVAGRRDEMLAAVQAIAAFAHQPVEAIDPQKFQAALAAAAPRWFASAWLHKYLHLNFPTLLTRNATQAYSEAQLYRVGEVPTGFGVFALDVQIIRFWNSVPALTTLSAELRYRVGNGLGPRNHWCLGLAGEVSAWKEMLAHEHLALGPAKVGNLAEAIALNKRRDVRLAVATAFESAGLGTHSTEARNLTELACRLMEGSIVALFSDASTVVAVGEVTGGYRFIQGAERPHRVPVRWFHHRSFETSAPVEVKSSLMKIEATHPAVADIEASLMVNGVGPWPNFASTTDATALLLPKSTAVSGGFSTGANADAPPPLEGISRHVVEMLERKRQVILFGPPGTGKTYHAERIALEVVAWHNFKCLPAQLSEPQRNAIYGRGNPDPTLRPAPFTRCIPTRTSSKGIGPTARASSWNRVSSSAWSRSHRRSPASASC
jgi:5-methylcytosine-specific restriction enzyme B